MSKYIILIAFSVFQLDSIFSQENKEFYKLGLEHLRIDDNETALFYFDRALKKAPFDTEILFRKGVVLDRLRKYKEAIKVFTNVISYSDKPFANSYLSRGDSKIHLGDFYGGLEDYEIAHSLDKTNCYVLFQKAEVYYFKLKDYEKVLIELNRPDLIKEDCFGYIDCKILESKNYLMLNNPEATISTIEKLIEYFDREEFMSIKDKPEILSIRGLAHLFLNEKEEGCRDLSKAGQWGYEDAYLIISKYCN